MRKRQTKKNPSKIHPLCKKCEHIKVAIKNIKKEK